MTRVRVGQLQWGHGDFAVENPAGTRLFAVDLARLQWGHGDFAVENIDAGDEDADFAGLQWGHGDFAVENF